MNTARGKATNSLLLYVQGKCILVFIQRILVATLVEVFRATSLKAMASSHALHKRQSGVVREGGA